MKTIQSRFPLSHFAPAALLTLVSLLGSVPAHSQTPALLDPGFWEVITRPDFPGVPAIPLPKTDRLCLAETDIAAGKISLRSAPTCRVQGGKWTDRRLNLDIACSDAPPEARMAGELQADGKSFSGHIDLVSQPAQEGAAKGHFIYHHSGKWLADSCPPPKMMTPNGPIY